MLAIDTIRHELLKYMWNSTPRERRRWRLRDSSLNGGLLYTLANYRTNKRQLYLAIHVGQNRSGDIGA